VPYRGVELNFPEIFQTDESVYNEPSSITHRKKLMAFCSSPKCSHDLKYVVKHPHRDALECEDCHYGLIWLRVNSDETIPVCLNDHCMRKKEPYGYVRRIRYMVGKCKEGDTCDMDHPIKFLLKENIKVSDKRGNG